MWSGGSIERRLDLHEGGDTRSLLGCAAQAGLYSQGASVWIAEGAAREPKSAICEYCPV